MMMRSEVLLSKGQLGVHCRINVETAPGVFTSYVLYCNSRVITGSKAEKGGDSVTDYETLFSYEDILDPHAVTPEEVMVLSMTRPGWRDIDTKMVYIASGISILFKNRISEENMVSWVKDQF